MDESGQFCLGSISHCRDKLARFILGRHFTFVPFYYIYFYDLHACIALCMQYLPLDRRDHENQPPLKRRLLAPAASSLPLSLQS
jgi:hypothetical protein